MAVQSRQAARWLEFIEEYDFNILHRAGQVHNNCDALSRRSPEDDTNLEGIATCQYIAQPQPVLAEAIPELSKAAISEAQRNDPNLQMLVDAVGSAKS